MKRVIKGILIVGIFYTNLLFGSSSVELNEVIASLKANISIERFKKELKRVDPLHKITIVDSYTSIAPKRLRVEGVNSRVLKILLKSNSLSINELTAKIIGISFVDYVTKNAPVYTQLIW